MSARNGDTSRAVERANEFRVTAGAKQTERATKHTHRWTPRAQKRDRARYHQPLRNHAQSRLD